MEQIILLSFILIANISKFSDKWTKDITLLFHPVWKLGVVLISYILPFKSAP